MKLYNEETEIHRFTRDLEKDMALLAEGSEFSSKEIETAKLFFLKMGKKLIHRSSHYKSYNILELKYSEGSSDSVDAKIIEIAKKVPTLCHVWMDVKTKRRTFCPWKKKEILYMTYVRWSCDKHLRTEDAADLARPQFTCCGKEHNIG